MARDRFDAVGLGRVDVGIGRMPCWSTMTPSGIGTRYPSIWPSRGGVAILPSSEFEGDGGCRCELEHKPSNIHP